MELLGNKELFDDLLSWHKYKKNIYVWHYITNFSGYFQPFPNINTTAQDIKTFANKYLGFSFMGNITHKPWVLTTAKVDNQNLEVLKSYKIVSQHKDILFCKSLEVTTSKLQLI